MTSEERLELIATLAKKGAKKKKSVTRKLKSDFVPLEPIAPSERDIEEEIEFLTNYKAENYINYEE